VASGFPAVVCIPPATVLSFLAGLPDVPGSFLFLIPCFSFSLLLLPFLLLLASLLVSIPAAAVFLLLLASPLLLMTLLVLASLLLLASRLLLAPLFQLTFGLLLASQSP
jgi:hypothetical protein